MKCDISINLPGSKSIAARALVCRLLGAHDTVMPNLPDCGDTRGMLRLSDTVRRATLSPGQHSVDIGEGGTTLRFGLAACASIPGLDISITGSNRLMQRPHKTLLDALLNLGADITILPDIDAIKIKGKLLSGGVIDLDGSVSSQYLSALMLAAPVWKEDTLFRISAPVVSRPYIVMTAAVMRDFGAKVEIADVADALAVKVSATGYAQCARYEIEGDWSGASYFFESKLIMQKLGLPVPDISMPSLKAPAESLQGDSRVAEIFAVASRRLSDNDSTPIVINLNDAPDLVPALAVGFCIAGIQFRIEGVAHLRHKETDRMQAIATELGRLGFAIHTGEDFMAWEGKRCDSDPNPMIRTYLDHRMAMAFAPARLAIPNLEIENPGVVEKSFPTFWKEISKIL